jgi:hypothetical protein
MIDEQSGLSGTHPSEHETAADLTRADVEIRRAQRQIARGVSELAEGIAGLSLVLLDVRRRQLYRFDPEFTTFESFVEQRHGISVGQALAYVEALTSLGEDHYLALLNDLGFQRTYALAMLKQTDPTLMAAFQTLPDEERRTVTVAQIEAIDATVTNQVQVEELEQAIVRERGLHQHTRRRLQDLEELHQRVTGSLIEERDTAQRALDQEQHQTERLRRLLDETRRQTARPEPAAAPEPAPTVPAQTLPALPPPETDGSSEAVVVVVSTDLPALVNDLHGVARKLTRLSDTPPDESPTASAPGWSVPSKNSTKPSPGCSIRA